MVTRILWDVRAVSVLGGSTGVRVVCLLAAALVLLGVVAVLSRRSQRKKFRRELAGRRRAELLQNLDVRRLVRAGTEEEMRALGKEVCRRMTATSRGTERVAMMLRQPGGRVVVAGSVGMDDLSVRSLESWSGEMGWQRRKGDVLAAGGADAVEVRLDRRAGRGDGMSLMSCQSAMVLPMRASTGEMLGALAVGLPVTAGGRRRGVEIAPLRAMVERLGRELEEVLRRTGGLAERKGEAAKGLPRRLAPAGVAVAEAPTKRRRRSMEAGVVGDCCGTMRAMKVGAEGRDVPAQRVM